MSETMRAWQCAAPGPLSQVMKLVDTIPQPSAQQLKSGQILVRVASASLNPADYKIIEIGLAGRAMVPWPKTLAMDLAGYATAVGPDVTDVKEGDAIMGRLNPMKGAGALCEYVVLDREGYSKISAKLDIAQVAGAPTAALTEYQTIAPHVKPGDKVFINGGSGGIGTFGIQIAKNLGCHVTTTCSTQKVSLCKELGADEVIDYKNQDVLERLKEVGPEFAVFIDNVGNNFEALYKESDKFLRPGGQYTIIGVPMSLGVIKGLLSASLWPSFLGGGKRKFSVFMTKPSHEDMVRVADWMGEGKLKTVVDSTYQFEDALKAFDRLKTGSCHGKVLVNVQKKQRIAIVTLALYGVVSALEVTILADTNRDGRVDTLHGSDTDGRNRWTKERGAIFIANIAETDRRCSKLITNETANEDLDRCHDASDNILRNPRFLAPLRTLPLANLSLDALGFISVMETEAVQKVRVFQKSAKDQWIFVDSNYVFAANELATGLELGIDARDVRRPGVWDGRVTLKFKVLDGEEIAEDTVALRVAPVLTHHHGQAVERVFVTEGEAAWWRGPQLQFIKDIKKHVADAGISAPVYEFRGNDQWAQDFFETGYTSFPGPEGPEILRIMIRSAQYPRPPGCEVFTSLRDAGVGAVQVIADGFLGVDSTGNLETIPPYSHNGKSYPVGRIIMGTKEGRLPRIIPFLQAQELQEPLILDTDWLAVGHVDEFLQFLPANTKRGWVLMADDPRAGIDLMEQIVRNGHGATRTFSRPSFPSDEGRCVPTFSVDDLLVMDRLLELNERAAQHIDANLDTLKRETGIRDDEIFRIPAIYNNQFKNYRPCNGSSPTGSAFGPLPEGNESMHVKEALASSGSLEKRQMELGDRVMAWLPGIINGLVLTDSVVLAPNPWGPVIEGVDVLATAAADVYRKANYNVTFMDDFFSHHVGGGEVHCGSNVWRAADAQWWKHGKC
ncbi:Zinc-type alcohol dehydrogenase-like protein [Paramyrothecium foliicola]|nr:Zinc-type alcohol dehydrogenase-like protein [Paramyrothecium foliicola]